MSNSNPLYTKKEFSLVSRAIQEFNKTSPKSNPNSTAPVVSGDNELGGLPRKGANLPKKRSVLGRGLSSLMSSTATVDIQQNATPKPNETTPIKTAEVNEQKSLVQKIETVQISEETKKPTIKSENTFPFEMLSIDQLAANPNQPRTTFDQKEIRELAASIRKSGVLQPLLVRKKSNSTSAFASFEIVAGERRWRAAKEAGLIKVPAIIKELDDLQTLEISIIENIQRQDLNPLEEAISYKRLMTEFGNTQEQISQSLGKDRSSIANCLRLLNLPESIQELLRAKKITQGHARAILSLESESEQIELANQLASEKLSVRETEKIVTEKKAAKGITANGAQPKMSANKAANAALEERLRRALGTKVKVSLSSDGKGDIKISFFSKNEIDSFLEKVKA